MNIDNENIEITENELYEHHRIVVDKGQDLLRIDKFLVDRLRYATRNKIQNAIKCDAIKVNEVAVKSNYKVKPQDVITISLPNPPRDEEIIPEDIPLNIIFEDNDIIVINKPAGMVMHPAHNNWTGTLVNALAYYFQNPKPKSQIPNLKSQNPKPKTQNPNPKSKIRNPKSGIGSLVHRIDKDTSGLVVVAKSELALAHLAKQFFEHTIERTYLALVWGNPSSPPTSPPLTPPPAGGGRTGQHFTLPQSKSDGKVPPPAGGGFRGAVSVEIINIHTIKPLDVNAVIASVKKTKCVVTAEEHQIHGGLGGAISECLAQNYPVPQEFVAVKDSFGESGKPEELLQKYGLAPEDIVKAVQKVVARKALCA